MKRIASVLIALCIFLGAFYSAAMAKENGKPAGDSNQTEKPYLVIYKSNNKMQMKAFNKGGKSKRFKHIPVEAVRMTPDIASELENDPDVLLVEPDGIVNIEEAYPWNVTRIKADIAQSNSITGQGIKVAVLDTGIDAAHQDLWVAGGVSFVSVVDEVYSDGENSVVEDVYSDDNGHGTHVAGIISALVNDIGVIGVSPGAELYSEKVLDKDGIGTYSQVISAIDWAIENNINIVCMSFGGSQQSVALEQAMQKAHDSGILLVAAAGNSGSNGVLYPARYDSVIAVGALDQENHRAEFSAVGPELELMAPGVGIESTLPGNSYGVKSGTSFAAPHVAGAAALIWSEHSDYTCDQVRDLLKQQAQPLGDSAEYGNGMVDLSGSFGDSGQEDLLPGNEDVAKINSYLREDIEMARVAAANLLESGDPALQNYGAKVLGEVGDLSDLNYLGILAESNPQQSVVEQVYTAMAKIGVRSYPEEDKKISALESALNSTYPLARDYAIYQLGRMDSEEARALAGLALPQETDPGRQSVLEAVYMNAAEAADYSVLSYPRDSVDGLINLLAYNRQGDGQTITAGQSARVSLQVYSPHSRVEIKVYAYGIGYPYLAEKVFYNVSVGQTVPFTWSTKSSTTPGKYMVWYHYPDNDVYSEDFDDYFTIRVEAAQPPEPNDRYEPNNSTSQATPIQCDRSYTAYISKSDNDYFRFTAGATGTLTFNMTGPSEDFDVKLLNSSGRQIAGSARSGSNESFSYSVKSGDTYYIRIYGSSGAYSSSPYTFSTSLQAIKDQYEENNSLSTATAINLGRSYKAYIDYEGDQDFYRFTPNITGSLAFGMDGPCGPDYDVALLDSSGGIVAESKKSGCSESFAAAVTAGNIYYLKIYGYGSNYDSNRSYRFLTSLSARSFLSITSITVPARVVPGRVFTVEAKIKNTSGITASGVEAEITLPAGLSVQGINPQSIGQIRAGAEGSASWQIIANVPAPSKVSVSVKALADNADQSSVKSADINIERGMLTGAEAAEKISVTFPEEMDGIYGEGHIACPVNTANGAYVLAQSLITVNGAQPVDFMVHYNSLLLHEGSLGRGWGHNYETRAEVQSNGDVIVYWDNSRKNTFVNNSGVLTPGDLANRFDSLVKNADGTFTLSRQDQTMYVFDAAGRLLDLENGHGQRLTMNYDGTGRLAAVTEPVSGQSLTFTYDTNGRIGSVSDRTGRSVSFSYDSHRNLTGITDPNGKRTTYTYTSDGRLFKIRNPEGLYQITNSYDDQGRMAIQDDAVSGNQTTIFSYDETSQPGRIISTVIDRNGQTRVFTYDDQYQLLSVRDQLGNTVSYQYDQNGNRISEADAAGRTGNYTYDDRGNLLTVTDPAGHVTRMTYDGRNNLLSLGNAAGKKITYEYDANNNPVRITDPMNKTTTLAYDGNGLLQSVNRPDLGTTTYSYRDGLLETVTDPENNNVSYDYDGAGRVVGITNGAGETTNLSYDDAGNLLTAKDPLSNSVNYTYDSRGNMLTGTDARGKKTYYTYNGNNKLISVKNALGKTTRYEYDGEDRLARIVDARGNAVTMNYDAKGRLVSAVDPLGNTTTYGYNAVDALVSQRDAMSRQVLSISYDAVNNPLTVTDALGRTVTNQYDVLSRLTRVTDPLNHATQFQYDDLNRLVLTTDAMSGQARQSFDAAGNRLSLTDPNNNQSTYQYDDAGRLVSGASAAGRTVSYGYNAQNLISRVTNGRGQEIGYQYDGAGRIVSITRPGGTVSYTYDANGNVLTVTDGSGAITREYDALNRVTQYTDTRGNVIKYTYDAVGNLTTLTYPGGKQVKYEYDAANRLTRVTDWAGRATVYEYDANSRLVKTTWPDGTVLTAAFDAAGQLVQQKDVDPSGSVILKYDYTYDAAGNITTEESGSEAPLAVDNTDMTYTSDNRLATYKGQSVQYDADGNMTRGPLGGGMAVFAYDSLSRLTGVDGTGYVYDAEDSRISVTDSVYQTTTGYVVNPHAPLSQVLIKSDSRGQTYYVYGLGLIGQQDPDGAYRTYHYDYRGSTVALTGTNGGITDRFQYGPYGEVTRRMGGTDTPFLYCGQYGIMHDANGLYYMRARYYSPEVGRFISRDSYEGEITNPQSLNLYAYVLGSPLKYVDPTGHWLENVHYNLTYNTAVNLGFSETEAGIIAWYDINVDYDSETDPKTGDQGWHFNRSIINGDDPNEVDTRQTHADEMLASAKELLKNPQTREQGLAALGQGLHALQDIDGHLQLGAQSGGRIYTPHDQGWVNYAAGNDHTDDTNYDYVNGNFVNTGQANNVRYQRTVKKTIDYINSVKCIY